MPKRTPDAAPNNDLFSILGRWSAWAASLPPRPWCIKASHAVPYGQVFRQWDSRGRLIMWANRGEIADLPRREPKGYAIAPNVIDMDLLTSIPVVFV